MTDTVEYVPTSLNTRLRRVFDTVLEIDTSLPNAELRYQQTPGWDSLGAVLLIASIEDEFGVEIGTERALRMETFDAAVRLLHDLGVKD
jgi:acyl carrier protein